MPPVGLQTGLTQEIGRAALQGTGKLEQGIDGHVLFAPFGQSHVVPMAFGILRETLLGDADPIPPCPDGVAEFTAVGGCWFL